MKLRLLLTSLIVVALIAALTAPLAGAQQRDTSPNGAPAQPTPAPLPPAPPPPDHTAADRVPAQVPAAVQPPGTPAQQVSDQDDLYRRWQEGTIDDKEYDRLAPVESCGLNAGWPGPDGFGYTGQVVAYNWVEISGSGTPVYLGDDDYLGPFPVGFSFNFYGTPYSEFYLASNGYLTFGSGISDLSNDCPLPNGSTPNNMIAMMWDDLNFNISGQAYYQTFGSCPVGTGQCTIIEYDDVAHYGGAIGSAGTWEAILYAATGDVLLQYQDGGAEEGAGSTTGIEGNNFDADHGLTYRCDTAASITDGLAVKFLFPAGLMLTPESAAGAGCEDGNVTHTLTLANWTGADGTFALDYSSGWPISGPAALFVAAETSARIDVTVSIPCGGASDIATVTASGNGYTGSSTLTTSRTGGGFTAWESIDPINGPPRSRPAAAAVNGRIYVLGGEITGGRADTVEEFDPATGLWTTQAGLMPAPASNVCAAAIGADIYVPGGYDALGAYLNTLQVYHTATDTWETVATDPLPAPRAGAGCAALDGKLYAFGGTDGTYQGTTYVYDPAAPAGSRWTTLSNMAYARAYMAGAAVNGRVYAVGGRDGSTTDFAYVEAYNPADGLWHTVTNMNSARGGAGAMAWGDLLVVCGGGWGTYLNTCEAYDTTTGDSGAWTALPQTMITGRRTFAYASLPEALYAVAGYSGAPLTAAERLPAFVCTACPPPDLSIAPPSLYAEQCTDSTTTQTLTICDAGEGNLAWSLSEQSPSGGMQVLYDNGPLVTHPGGGLGGGDASVLQSALGMTVYGFGHQVSVGNRVADDFVVADPAGWDIQRITFFAYQTSAPASPSPITGLYYRIWNGPPDNSGSSVVFGNLTTNRLLGTTFSNIYRVLDTSLLDSSRRLFANVASAGVFLPPGTYWLEWMTDGSLTSGPWVPPVTIPGQTTTGNAKQWLSSSSTWSNLVDVGPQGLPFLIEGETGPTSGKVAIFKDANPWGSVATEAFLGANGIPYEVHTSAEFGSLDFTDYPMIVVSGDQPQSFYDAYAGYVAKFEAYVAQGGFLNFLACDAGWNGGALTAPLPAGMTWTGWTYEDENNIDAPAHPVVQGVPNPFYGNHASHGHFAHLPAAAHVIARQRLGHQPTIVEYPIGAGWLIAFGQPLEISYDWGWDAGTLFRNTLLWGHGFTAIPWLRETPLTGRVNPDQCRSVEMTFDATGLSVGIYAAELRVASNDPDEPQVDVPVQLVVPECPAIDVTPPSLLAEHCSDMTSTQTLNICNLGLADDLRWCVGEQLAAPGGSAQLGSVQVAVPAGPATAPGTTAVASGPYRARPEGSHTVQRRAAVASPPDVLLVHADDGAGTIQSLLQAYGDLGTVDLFNARAGTPTLVQLQAYDVVLTWPNYVYANPVAMGNVLADYVDAGGKVVDLMFAMGSHTFRMQGRFIDQTYTAMNGGAIDYATSCMAIYHFCHPITAGVTNVCDYYRLAGTYLTPGSTAVGYWQDGELFVAAKDNRTVVSIAGYVGHYHRWLGQMPDVVHNAILWLASPAPEIPWLSEHPTGGIVPPGECALEDITFDSTGLGLGTHTGALRLASNDPHRPWIDIPVQLAVGCRIYLPVVLRSFAP